MPEPPCAVIRRLRRLLPGVLLAAVVLPAACTLAEAAGAVAVEVGRRVLVDNARKNFGDYADSAALFIDVLFAHVQPIDERPRLDLPERAPTPTPQVLSAQDGLEVATVRETKVGGSWVAVALQDGDVVRDGRGDPEGGDNLKIRITPSTDGYVYAAWIDATAWIKPLHPFCEDESFANPVRAGQTIEVPSGELWFELDENRGIETLYVLFSRAPRPDLEAALRPLVSLERPIVAVDGGALATVEQTADISRGLGRRRPGRSATVITSDGTAHPVTPTLFEPAAGAADLVVTRWFRHE